jgi:V8-like Glu-specific endopeptidase
MLYFLNLKLNKTIDYEKNTINMYIFRMLFLCSKSTMSTEEQPYSWERDEIFVETIPVIVMPSLDMEAITKEDLANEGLAVPFRFGFTHEVNLSLANSGAWKTTSDGGRLWTLRIYSPDALSLNLIYDQFWLPEGAKFFLYATNMEEYIGAFTNENNEGDKETNEGFATGFLFTNNIVLEYYEPAEVSDNGIISVAQVISGYRNISDFFENPLRDNHPELLLCHNDVKCTEGTYWQQEKNAIALMVMGGSTCTGALLNTTENDYSPIFLTANHCYKTNPKSWIFYWNYEAPTCGGVISKDSKKSTEGANILAKNSDTDFLLLKLRKDPAKNRNVILYYLGWDRRYITATSGVSVHHPLGSQKKISIIDTTINNYPYTIQWGEGVINQVLANTHWYLYYTNGTTQKGSSGSPLINQDRRVIGQMHAGSDPPQCPPDAIAFYGRFDVSWDSNDTIQRQLKHWLDPNNTGATTVDGTFDCKGNITINNKTYSSGSNTVTEGCTITISNTIFQNGAVAKFYARDVITINPGTIINAGSHVLFVSNGSVGSGRTGENLSSPNSKADEEIYDNEEILNSLELALELPKTDIDFTVYPNPNDGNFTVKITGRIEPYTVEIFNAMGVLIGKVDCYEDVIHVNRADLPAGIYYVRMTITDKVIVKKVVIQ